MSSPYSRVYFYIVYEPFFRYKEYDKVYEIDITSSQVDIKEKYLDKDKYKIEFFEITSEYSSKVMKYIQEKYIKSSFPINIRSGELQVTCMEFIKKCNDLMQEKLKDRIGINNNMPLLLTSPHKIIAMVKHKGTNEVTVVCNNDVISPNDFISQLTSHVLLHASLLLPLPLLPSFSTDEYITVDFIPSPGDLSKKRRTDA